jgi:hypothetical protein
MSLTMSVGLLAFLHREDSDCVEQLQAALADVNRLLVAEGLPEHHEPASLPPIETGPHLGGFPYSWLHYLRRAYAYAVRCPGDLKPLEEDDDPTTDDILDRELSRCSSHLICHSDCEGFYVPIDFPEPLYATREIEIEGGMLGSSQGVLRELVRVAPLIGIQLKDGVLSARQAREMSEEEPGKHPYWLERQVWLTFHEKANASVRYASAICFG